MLTPEQRARNPKKIEKNEKLDPVSIRNFFWKFFGESGN